MNLRKAFGVLVREFGVADMALAMKANAGTLQNKANANSTTHEPSLEEAGRVTVISGNPLIAEAFAELAGGVFVPTSRLSAETVPDLYRSVHELTRELGDVLREIDEGMKDGRVTPAERDKIQRNIFELIEKAAALGKRVDLMAQPVDLRAVK